MKKIIAMIIAATLCLSVFAGCGQKAAPAPAAAPAATEEKKDEAPAAEEAKDEAPAAEEAAAPAAIEVAEDGPSYNLLVANHDASTSMCEEYIETLCNKMGEASKGRLSFTFNPGGSLLGATETIDGVKDGAADICWSCTSFFSARFPIAEFINLCGTGINSARMATDVFQKMYEEVPGAADEFKDWKVIALHACSYGPVSTINKKIEKPEDFKGLQIRTAGTIASQYVQALGATPMTIPTSEVYEAVEKKVIDGFTNDWHNIDCFKLYEPIDYCLNLPISFTSCFVLMNKDVYEGMPDDLKAVIDAFSGDYAGDMAGYWWDSCNYWVADKMRANDVEVYEPSEELFAWATSDDIVGPIHEWYINYLNDAGLDGQAIYDQCMAIVAEYTDAHADDWAAEFHYSDWNEDPFTYGK